MDALRAFSLTTALSIFALPSLAIGGSGDRNDDDRLEFPWTDEFVFPSCPKVKGMVTRKPDGKPLAEEVTITFEISGDAVFEAAEKRRPELSLYFQRKGDDWTATDGMAAYRWYSRQRVPIAEGTHTLTVPLTVDRWGDVYAGSNAESFAEALADPVRVGYVLGSSGGAAHGVCAKTGSARFKVKNFEVTGD